MTLGTNDRRREALVMLLTGVVLLALPWILPLVGGYRELATRIVIWAIFALGFDLLVGFTGLLSFGHAAMWGAGAYAAGYWMLHGSPDAGIALACGAAVATVLSVVLGFLCLRRQGIYFAILTLAFGEMLYFAALSPLQQWTGGENGLTGLPPARLFGSVLDADAMYALVAAIAFAAVYAARRLARSPWGLVLRAMRANERRLQATGFHVDRYKLVVFVVSGLYAGIAGSLYAIYETYVPTESLHWSTSGQVVMMSVIGGLGSLFGPMFGAGLVLYLQNVLSAWTEQWLLIQGAVFMAVVIFFPGGLAQAARLLREARRRRASRRQRATATHPTLRAQAAPSPSQGD